jgi:hypothetical protein
MLHAARQLPSWLIFDVSQEMLIRALLFLVALLFAGCPAVDFNELDFTRSKPKQEELVGVWVPTSDTQRDIRKHYPQAEHEIVFRPDGTYSFTNMPDWWRKGTGESGGKFESFSGKWALSQGKNGWTIWEISLETPRFFTSVNVYRQKPPYQIFIRVGDPNEGISMIFERKKNG